MFNIAKSTPSLIFDSILDDVEDPGKPCII